MPNVPKRELGETINYAIAAYKQGIEVDKIFTATPTDANGWLAAFIERAIACHIGIALREAGENHEPVALSPADQLAANLAKLPAKAFVKNTVVADGPHGRPPVLGITRGESGYNPVYTALTADELNEAEGVTQAQARAMYNGSIFGFDTASADPDSKFNNLDTKES